MSQAASQPSRFDAFQPRIDNFFDEKKLLGGESTQDHVNQSTNTSKWLALYHMQSQRACAEILKEAMADLDVSLTRKDVFKNLKEMERELCKRENMFIWMCQYWKVYGDGADE